MAYDATGLSIENEMSKRTGGSGSNHAKFEIFGMEPRTVLDSIHGYIKFPQEMYSCLIIA